MTLYLGGKEIRSFIDARYVPQGRPMDTPRPPR